MPTSPRQIAPFLRKSAANSQLPDGADRVVGPYNNTALSVGADDSVRPRDVPILRESSANSQLPPTSKEVTACGFAANSRRNSLHSAGRAEPRPYQLRLHFNGFCVKQTVYGLRVYLKTPNAPGQRAFLRCAASFFLEIRQYSCEKMSCATQKSLAAGHIMSFQIHPKHNGDVS